MATTLINQKEHWKFHWLTRWEEIWDEGFVHQWQAWLDESPSAHVFFHPAMVKAWVETYLPLRDLRPCFLIAESADHTVFFPMILWRRNWKNAFQRLLVPVGYSDYDYHDPIIVGPNHELFIESFWHEFAQELISASPVKFDSLNIDGVRQSFSPCNNQPYKDSRWIKSSICPWIDLRTFKNPEEFLPSLKSSLRQDLRRQKRRIDAIGEAQFFVFTEADELQAMKELQVFLAVHARRWPMSYRAPRFHELLIKFCLPAKKIHFSVLRINGHSAAWHLSFIHQDRLCSYIPAQKEEFDNLSPGKVLLLKCIEDSIARGLSIYDFLRGEENYKTGWTDKAETLWSLKVDENHLTSRLRNIVVDRAKPVVKTILSMK